MDTQKNTQFQKPIFNMQYDSFAPIKKIQSVIIAGGLGQRLWPISTSNVPKQFHKFDQAFSLLQNTIIRNQVFGEAIIITNQKYLQVVLEQTQEINAQCEIIVENTKNGTATSSILAALATKAKRAQYTLLLPADHSINDTDNYIKNINLAANVAKQSQVVTIGVTPTSASQEYGYIERGRQVGPKVYECARFIEKPSLEIAEEFFNNKDFLWNSGIFLYCPDKFLSSAARLQPSILSLAQGLWSQSNICDTIIYIPECQDHNLLKNTSIDYAFIEKMKNIKVVHADFDWKDVGSFASLFELKDKDHNNNYLSKNSFTTSDVKNCYVMHDKKMVLLIGVENIVVISDNKNLLISTKDKLHELKNVMNDLKIDKAEM